MPSAPDRVLEWRFEGRFGLIPGPSDKEASWLKSGDDAVALPRNCPGGLTPFVATLILLYGIFCILINK